MELLSLLAGILSFVIVIILLQSVGIRLDLKKKRLQQIEDVNNNDFDEVLSKPFSERFITPIFTGIVKTVSKLVPKSKKTKTKNSLEKDLKLAGIKLSTGEFMAVRIIVLIFCFSASSISLVVGELPPMARLLIVLFGVVLAVLIPRYFLSSSVKRRQGKIKNQMPDILDLISVSVEAGLGFDAALVRVCERSKGPLVDELTNLYHEIQMGRPRRDALKDLSDRSTVGELKVFLSSLIQADQLGISIKNVLKAQSQQLRLSRKQYAEERAMKAPVKMMLPLIIFIFPVIFIILLGPALIKIMDTFGSK
ncbi:MAG: type II secretion system F family protein [Saccharofermentanales bacterium]